ncbi:MAG TPA: leucyl aminopeptidase family protein [Methylophilaceae bacterium]|nr:leucyl aminopeptidase family protein [Methylophilaceae bacterium]
MTISLKQTAALADEKSLASASHILFILPTSKSANIPFGATMEAKLKRSHVKYAELAKTPLSSDLPNGAVASWVVLDDKLNPFQRHTLLRKALKCLLDEKPQALTIAVYGDDQTREQNARDAFYVAAVNAADLPTRKSGDKSKQKGLKAVALYGWKDAGDFAEVQARAVGNALTRQLTMLPPNELTPTIYRKKIEELAQQHSWKHEEYDMKKLRKLGAGAFVAVGQGSEPQDAAIVHLTYNPKGSTHHIALIGKGICFDTGGHNLKPARYMHGMHEDMNGSAVALGILLAATQAKLPVKIDCWLAIAQNHIGPLAYKQNDVVTALNGTTIEIVHTDAEGRMVLSDTLTLASREKPQFMMDFATLTGSMVSAVGTRYSGVLGNRPELLDKAVAAGTMAGERVAAFPFDDDYEEDLESGIADIKQCTLESEADHVLAARFLAKFIENDVPWVHVDLSACNRKGGLGAVGSDVTGFGVGLGLEMLRRWMIEAE